MMRPYNGHSRIRAVHIDRNTCPTNPTPWFAWLSFVVITAFQVSLACANDSPASINFDRQIAPLLKRACVECHGAKRQEGGLRLDSRQAAMKGGDSGPVITPGSADLSELITRISRTKNSDGVMPALGETLHANEIRQFRQWIDSGAVWGSTDSLAAHWSYSPPSRPPLPATQNRDWARTPIDHFILERFEREKIVPATQAEPERLLRRLYLDVIGLPPSPADVDEFLADSNPGRYERTVDRLLASPQFGVRWARPWLDYARYADSHGFQRDDFRDVWPYRDWVVSALNSDMPFDQFTLEQIAGDLLPNASEQQKIASGFNRNAPTNVEAGSDPEETRVNQVIDRVNTLGMIWLGSTLECCQCHDHKYDPFSARDYYGLFAFFNNTAVEADRSNPKVPGSIRFLGPELTLKDEQIAAQRDRLTSQIDEVTRKMAALEAGPKQTDPVWEASLLSQASAASQEHVLDIREFEALGGSTHEILPDKSVLLSGEAPDRDTYTITVKTTLAQIRAFKLEALTDPSLPGSGPGRGDANRPNFVLNTFSLTVASTSDSEPQEQEFAAAKADFSQPRFPASGAIDKNPKTAWAINPKFHEPHWAIFDTAQPIGDGTECVLVFRLEQNYGGSRTIGRLRLTALTGDREAPALPADLVAALKIPAEQRTPKQARDIVAYRLKDNADYQSLQKQKTSLSARLDTLKPPSSLVMQELESPRPSMILTRGDFRTPGESVAPATPSFLHPLWRVDTSSESNNSTQRPATRLDLARWLVRPDNPLVARVTVNRYWAELFGNGLVTTPEDFGLKGEFPTHPELLDWLAVEYMERGWSMKQLLRQILLSATYQQSSRVNGEQLARDSQNLFYARGPRYRLDAESIRDTALTIAGQLSLNQGGAPIRPYQPDGIWIKVGGQRYDYVVSPGEREFRRGLYIVWKRGAPYPSFMNFDASNRMTCRVKRPRSNTPLQALTLMNDPVYVDAAKWFARRVIEETPGADVRGRATHAFRMALARSPKAIELEPLIRLYEGQLAASAANAEATHQVIASFALPAGMDVDEFVAWYAVATALLNLDETISKG